MRVMMYLLSACYVFICGCSLTTMGLTSAPDPNSDPTTGMEFVQVKGGCFEMGSSMPDGIRDIDNKPVHTACVDDFLLGKYEVTQGQWELVMGNNPSHFKECGPKCPVESVSWHDVQDFIKKLNARSNRNYRLPTEAEWEYAARSGGKNEIWAGTNEESKLTDYAWFLTNSENMPHKVGKMDPNGLGLYDMSGNVWEWCQDWFSATYYKESPKDNPAGAQSGDAKVTRGGCFANESISVRAINRNDNVPDARDQELGFRLLMKKPSPVQNKP